MVQMLLVEPSDTLLKKPNPDAFESSFLVEQGTKVYAEEDISNYNAMVNVPLMDGVAMRTVFSSQVDPGIYQNVMTGKKALVHKTMI